MTDTATPPARAMTPVDALADRYLEQAAALDPILATGVGISGHDDQLPALTPEWFADVSALWRRTLAELADCPAADRTDRITVAALRDELDVAEALRAVGADESQLNNIDSPLQAIREAFDLTPVATIDDWAGVATRLRAVESSVEGYLATLRRSAEHGRISPRRQVAAGIAECAGLAGPDGFFGSFAAGAAPTDGTSLPDSLRADLAAAAQDAAGAYDRLGGFLRDELHPAAPGADAVGRERYALHLRSFLGAEVDLDETYEWGQQELARIRSDMAATAERIRPGASINEAMTALDEDPTRLLSGTAALQRWMQETSDAAVEALGATHFDIPAEIRTLECRIAPTQQGGIYYTGPSEDLVTRPGRMWWSVPPGVTEFATWRERTTVYHEGVPGHHLQIAQTAYRRDLLNRWRRLAMWISGHGEGWALYAERLMAELGFLDDPADHLGMLDSQSLRAARVVIDIGVHCELPAPASVGGGAWTYDKAWAFLGANCAMPEAFRRFELDRYLGLPGQAPSYKIGERFWLQLRDDTRAAQGSAFDLKAFHRSALDLGSLGLDLLRAAVLGEI